MILHGYGASLVSLRKDRFRSKSKLSEAITARTNQEKEDDLPMTMSNRNGSHASPNTVPTDLPTDFSAELQRLFRKPSKGARKPLSRALIATLAELYSNAFQLPVERCKAELVLRAFDKGMLGIEKSRMMGVAKPR